MQPHDAHHLGQTQDPGHTGETKTGQNKTILLFKVDAVALRRLWVGVIVPCEGQIGEPGNREEPCQSH